MCTWEAGVPCRRVLADKVGLWLERRGEDQPAEGPGGERGTADHRRVTLQGRLGFLSQASLGPASAADGTGLAHILSGRGLDEGCCRLEKLGSP